MPPPRGLFPAASRRRPGRPGACPSAPGNLLASFPSLCYHGIKKGGVISIKKQLPAGLYSVSSDAILPPGSYLLEAPVACESSIGLKVSLDGTTIYYVYLKENTSVHVDLAEGYLVTLDAPVFASTHREL